jgi:hypothetical protein
MDQGSRLVLKSTSTVDAFLLHGYSARKPATIPIDMDHQQEWFDHFISNRELSTLVAGLVCHFVMKSSSYSLSVVSVGLSIGE